MQAPARTGWWTAVLVAGGAFLPACGDSEPQAPAATGPTAASEALRIPANPPGAKELLDRLRAHVAGGKAGPEVNQDIGSLRELLWPDVGDHEVRPGSEVHVTLAHTASAVGRTLALPAEVRAQVGEVDAISREIHHAWLTAASMPPEDYRAWCGEAGAALLLRLRADRAKLFENPLPSDRR